MEAYRRYIFGEFELDPQIHRLSREGDPVHLSKKPFNLLVYLIEHRERLVSRRELLEHFWDGHDVYEETLTKCVGAIRKAFGDTAETPRFIETRWAEGYRFVCPVEEVAPELVIERTRELKIVVDETDEPPISGRPAIAAKPRSFRLLTASVALCSVAAVTIGFVLWMGGRAAGSSEIRSVAILPLNNLTDDKNNDFLSDGISESLITSLSQIKGLKVIARGSSFTYRREADPIEIGRALNVDALLIGSVRRSGDSYRIAARMIDSRNGEVLWAIETQDRPASDVFALQDEIARKAFAGLRSQIGGPEITLERGTRNLEAYENYLRGRYFFTKRTVDSLKTSLRFYGRAAELDPRYSDAFAGMADSYQLLAEYRGIRTDEGFRQARQAAEKAVELDERSAEAHTALAYILAFYDWRWNEAEREFQRAIEINPNYSAAHQWYSELLTTLGRFDEAEREIGLALDTDPLSNVNGTDLAAVFYMTERYDETIAQSRKVLEADPDFLWGHLFLWAAYEQKGMEAESVASFSDYIERGWGKAEADQLRSAYSSGGKIAYWTKNLEQVNDPSPANIRLAWDRVVCYLRLEDHDQVFAWLERSFQERERWIMNIRYIPEFKPVRSDPRLADLVRRVGLDPLPHGQAK